MRVAAEVFQRRARRVASGQSTRTRVTPESRTCARLCSLILVLLACAPLSEARAEYGDIVINNFSEKTGARAAVFPHWFHRIRYTCKVCHTDLGFKMQAGGDKMLMADILDGRFCGACHNGQIAWGVENCDLCHSAKVKTQTQTHGKSLPQLSGGTTPPPAEPSGRPQ